jgi:hypothetical protein
MLKTILKLFLICGFVMTLVFPGTGFARSAEHSTAQLQKVVDEAHAKYKGLATCELPLLLEEITNGGIRMTNNILFASHDVAPTSGSTLDLERLVVRDVVADATAGGSVPGVDIDLETRPDPGTGLVNIGYDEWVP